MTETQSATQPNQSGERSDEKSDKEPRGAESGKHRDNRSAEGEKNEGAGNGGREAADTKDQPRDKSAEGKAKDEKSSNRENAAGSGDEKDRKGDRKRAQFEPRDKEKVRTYFSQHKPNVKRVDRDRVSVSIGVAIPGSIDLYPLPAGVVVVADCPLQFFLWGEDLVVVDSCSREVVDIVPNVG